MFSTFLVRIEPNTVPLDRRRFFIVEEDLDHVARTATPRELKRVYGVYGVDVKLPPKQPEWMRLQMEPRLTCGIDLDVFVLPWRPMVVLPRTRTSRVRQSALVSGFSVPLV